MTYFAVGVIVWTMCVLVGLMVKWTLEMDAFSRRSRRLLAWRPSELRRIKRKYSK